MYHIHTTNGFIVRSINSGEANKIIYIFTQDFGLILAIAQGVRYEKSKLRYNVRDFNFAKFSLVHGKEFWRLVGAEELDLPTAIYGSIKYPIIVRVASILSRLIQGEDKHQDIYDCLWNFANFEFDNEENSEFIATIESVLVIRILHRLGYIAEHDHFGKDIVESKFNRESIINLNSKRLDINRAINNALRESHL